MTIEEAFRYYKELCTWNMSEAAKRKILSNILEDCYQNHWRVVGITQEALNVFAAHGYKRVSRMGINRGHIFDRKDTLTSMLNIPFQDSQEWWEFFWDRDKTILMTSTENMTNQHSEVYAVPEGLFHTAGFAWKHGEDEVQFLTELAREV